jgi:valyl-tRNA synthetase
VDLDSVTQQLYGLPLGDFVTARNDQAKQARADGDRALATEIQALAKPTTAAWLVNQLSRESSDDLESLLELGRGLRDASASLDGETMRRLGRQRTELVGALVAEVRRIGSDRGSRVSDDVADEVRRTLEASLSDSEIADEISEGRMTRAVEYAGFGELTGFGGPTGIVREPKASARRRTAESTKPKTQSKDKPAKTSKSTPGRPADLGARRRQKAEREVAEAADRVEAARAAHTEATEEADRTEAEVERTEAEVQRLRAELSTAEREAKTARQANRAAQQRLASTERELAGVERIRDRAKDKLADLE